MLEGQWRRKQVNVKDVAMLVSSRTLWPLDIRRSFLPKAKPFIVPVA